MDYENTKQAVLTEWARHDVPTLFGFYQQLCRPTARQYWEQGAALYIIKMRLCRTLGGSGEWGDRLKAKGLRHETVATRIDVFEKYEDPPEDGTLSSLLGWKPPKSKEPSEEKAPRKKTLDGKDANFVACFGTVHPSEKPKVDEDGYATVRVGWKNHIFTLPQHRVVMSRMLQRPLKRGESVHHKNGLRNDNRPENLELWVKPPRTGVRVDDLVEYAKEILREHDPSALSENA